MAKSVNDVLEKDCNLLGLDLGISSIGWCLYKANKMGTFGEKTGEALFDDDNNEGIYFKPYRILDLGVLIFNALEDNKGKTKNIQRREKRSQRRQRRRKNLRLKDLRTLFKNYFKVDFINDVIEKNKNKNENPFRLKVRGLTQKLNEHELMIILYHYMKYRGFQSNRKAKDEADKKNNGKVLENIKKINENIGDKTITQYLLNELEARQKINPYDNKLHNSKDIYQFSISRDKYLEEINIILDKQIEFKVIDSDFKDKYIKIYMRRRSYSDGPGGDSPYKVNIDEMIANCIFDNEKRAPKDSMSAQKFLLLSSLLNFSYRILDEDYNNDFVGLDKSKIPELLEKFKYVKDVTYSKLLSEIPELKNKKDKIEIKGLWLGKKKYRTLKNKYSDNKEEFDKQYKKELLNQAFFKGSDMIYQIYENKNIKDSYRNDDNFYDDIAYCLTRNKDDEKIRRYLQNNKYDTNLIDQILEMNIDATKTIHLSLNILRKLNPLMEKGNKYDDAMEMLGYDHRKGTNSDVSSEEGYIKDSIDVALNKLGKKLNNPVVKNTLVHMRKIINAIVHTYGKIDDCVVELARELKASFEERKEIWSHQLDNQSDNNEIRNTMMIKFPDKFRNYKSISKDDLIRYKLYKEQNGKCPYTGEQIKENSIFDNTKYQVDHIVPFSLSFDDSYDNKVLVTERSNQEKGNNVPLQSGKEYIIRNFKQFISENKNITSKKRDNLLTKSNDDKRLEEWKTRDLNATSHLSKLAKELITNYVLPKNVECRSTSGGITSFLRQHWDLNNKTHTYEKKINAKDPYVSFKEGIYKAQYKSEYKFDSEKPIDNEENDKITFGFKYKKSISVSKIKKAKTDKTKKNSDELNRHERALNKSIDSFKDMYDSNNIKDYFINATISDVQEKIIDKIKNCCSSSSIKEKYEDILHLLGVLEKEIQKEIDKKNRSNHLHHALDAAIIGVCNTKLVKTITDINQKKKDGEKIIIEQPYENFKEEVAIRVYEQNSKDEILTLLNENVKYYKEHKLSKHDVHVLVPVRLVNHDIEGAISNETIYGSKQIDGKDRLIKTINIKEASKDIKSLKNNLEKIIYKESGNKAVYESIKQWIDNGHTKISEFPILKNKNVPIKSFKIDNGKVEGSVSLSENNDRFAENSDVVRVEVYYKKEDKTKENLYFVPVYYYQLFWRHENKKRINKKEIKYNLMYKQGEKGSWLVSGEELDKNYKLKCILPKYSFIEITLKKSKEDKEELKAYAYSAGASSGFFEIYSLLGDYKDLECELHKTVGGNQLLITISTIKDIKVKNISVLGKVS